jgi:hypothetical protein
MPNGRSLEIGAGRRIGAGAKNHKSAHFIPLAVNHVMEHFVSDNQHQG